MLNQVTKQEAVELAQEEKVKRVRIVRRDHSFYAEFFASLHENLAQDISELDGRKYSFYVELRQC